LYKFKLDRTLNVPVFRQISDALRAQIETGSLRQGDVIPSENELSTSLHVSRMTVRAAIDALAKEGMVVRQRGRGTVVARRPVMRTANVIGFMSFTEEMRARGLSASSRVLDFSDKMADSAVAAQLNLPLGGHVLHLERIRLANDEPMAIERCYLPYDRFPDLLKFDFEKHSLYKVLEAEYGVKPGMCEETVEALLLDPTDARLLGVKRGAPALRIQRITQDVRGNLIEAEQSTFRADRYRMVFLRQR
jgi:GntR family transcriptional regulator